jgi:hypothetical protein
MNRFNDRSVLLFILSFIAFNQPTFATELKVDSFRKNQLEIILPERCSYEGKEPRRRGSLFLCASCDTEICKAANEMFALYSDGSIVELSGDLNKKEKLFRYADRGDMKEYLGSALKEKEVSRKSSIESPSGNDPEFLIVGKNAKSLLPQIEYASFKSANEEQLNGKSKSYFDAIKKWLHLSTSNSFNCKPDDGYQTYSYEVFTNSINDKKYYSWEQKKIGPNDLYDASSIIESSGLLQSDRTCVEWYRSTRNVLGDKGSGAVLKMFGLLRLKEEFFVRARYVFYESGHGHLQQLSSDHTKLLPKIY